MWIERSTGRILKLDFRYRTMRVNQLGRVMNEGDRPAREYSEAKMEIGEGGP